MITYFLTNTSNIIVAPIRSIHIPRSKVIESLASVSGKNDSVSSENERGINIILLGINNSDKEPTVNLNLKIIFRYRRIDLVAKSVSHEFDLTKDTVVFYKQNMAEDILDAQFFPISRPTLVGLTGIHDINHHIYKKSNS
jgi:hypothetical protein